MSTILAVAPHPDDETLGCGGTLLRLKAEGARVGWLIVTGISEATGWPAEQVRKRSLEIETVGRMYGFDAVFNLGLPAVRLDTLPMSEIVGKIAEVFRQFEPTEVFLPSRSDAHSDHAVVFDAAAACTKWFRYPSVQRVLAYETISETDASLGSAAGFAPNYFVNIAPYLERKIAIMQTYASEMGAFPFPRSAEALRALAAVRGSAAGYPAAEAFQLLRARY
jgi:N-acetylglucosamine malate deacetylase 1